MPKKVKFENLLFKSESFWDKVNQKEKAAAFEFSEDYKKFLNRVKTEKQVVTETIKLANQQGFKEVNLDEDLNLKNKKLIFNNRGKSAIFIHLGENNLEQGAKVLLAHVDAPRLDLKVKPLYEDSGIAYFKPHYYGGIKKYHWPAIPLELHGTLILKNKQHIEISLGSKKDEPIFLISDLLPHLEQERMDKPLKKAIDAEELNIIVGSIPLTDKKIKNRVKLAVLDWLNKNYQIKEVDLFTADLHFVPHFEARDIGFDRSMLGAYGHDDRVCVYTCLQAFLESQNNQQTKILYLADKEEIGSVGATSAQSLFLENILDYLIKHTHSSLSLYDLFRKSQAISADVTAAFDPDYKSAYDVHNSAHLGHGLVLEKYLGYRGKMMTVDAEPKFIRQLINLFDQRKVIWQTGHLGKVDQL